MVLDFLQDIEETATADEVSRSFQRLIEKFGFTYFCTGAIKPGRNERGMVWATSLKHGWFTHWVRNGYISQDPVIWRLKQDMRPLRWRDLRDQGTAPRLDILDDAVEFGVRDGWSLAFEFGSSDVPAIAVGLGTDKYALRPEDASALHLASVYCGLKLAQFEDKRPEIRNLLSERERECLKWVAAGKTDWEISEIIGISHQTVHKHVSNSLGKLKARTRAHAVAAALATKQLAI